MAYETILVERRGKVGVITLNRPKALNALSAPLMDELARGLDELEADDAVGCLVVPGSETAFPAGADIQEMQAQSHMDVSKEDFITAPWETTTRNPKPVVEAGTGSAPGSGCDAA